MWAKNLIESICICLVLIAPAISDDSDEERCEQTYKLVFEGREQAKILPQETVLELSWMRFSCFEGDPVRQAEVVRFNNFANLFEEKCTLEDIEERQGAESAYGLDTNIARYMLEYNQLHYEACRPVMFENLHEKMKNSDNDMNKFCVKCAIIETDIIEFLEEQNKPIEPDDVRLKGAFQLILSSNDLKFMQREDLPFFTRRKMLFNEFEKLVGGYCTRLFDLLEPEARGLIRLHALTIRAPRINNPWINAYLFCRTNIDRLTIWNIDEEWKRLQSLPDVDLDLIKTIEVAPIKMVGGINLGDRNVDDIDPNFDEHADEIARKHKLLTKPNKPILSIEETHKLIVDLVMFYEKWSLERMFIEMRGYQNLFGVAPSHCRSQVIKTRALMVSNIPKSNISRYADFYNNLQFELCLGVASQWIMRCYKHEDNKQFVNRLTSLGYAAYKQQSSDKKGSSSASQSDFRLQAALDYLAKYGGMMSLPQKTQKKIFQLFETKLKRPCQLVLEDLKDELAVVNMILDVSKPDERVNLVAKETRLIMMAAKICRYFVHEAKDRKLHNLYKRIEGSMKKLNLNEDEEVDLDITDADLFHEPEFNRGVEPLFVIHQLRHDLDPRSETDASSSAS